MIIFLRLRKSPQTPKKKSVKETPKYLKASIGIVYFYAGVGFCDGMLPSGAIKDGTRFAGTDHTTTVTL